MTWVNYVNAIRASRLDSSLPWGWYRVTLLIFLFFTLLPGALWAGAITPVLSDKHGTTHLEVQDYKNTSWIKVGDSKTKTMPSKNTGNGFFTFSPAGDLEGTLINSASSASNRATNETGNSTNVVHAKLDKTNYSYFNRSYGVGAAVGLRDHDFSRNVTRYQYSEDGFKSMIECVYNKSDNLYFQPSANQPDGWLLQVYEAKGTLPNTKGNGVDYVAATMARNPAMVMINTDNGMGKYMIGMATFGPEYTPLNHTQCEVTFTPTEFSVAVDVINKTIVVEPIQDKDWFQNKTIADALHAQLLHILYDIAQSLSTSLYTNPIGSAFINNIAAVQDLNHDTSEKTNLTAIENTFVSILDDSMVAYTTAQIMLLNDIKAVPVNFTSNAYTFGTANYLYPIVSLNFLICFVVLVEMLRTKLWTRISKFDFIDTKNVIIAASDAGRGMAMESESLHRQAGSRWVADPDDRLIGGIRTVLAKGGSRGGGIAVTLENWDVEMRPRGLREGAEFGQSTEYTPGLRSEGEMTPGFMGVEDDRIPLKQMGQAMGHTRDRSRESNGSDELVR